jgi:toxin ParE1/3/4
VSGRFAVAWTQTAVDDLLSIIDYGADRDGPEAAERLHSQITHGVASLETMPSRCRVVPELEAEGIESHRELLVGPYRLMFAVRGGEVVLLTAVDGRRDLGDLLIERALRERDCPRYAAKSSPQDRTE